MIKRIISEPLIYRFQKRKKRTDKNNKFHSYHYKTKQQQKLKMFDNHQGVQNPIREKFFNLADQEYILSEKSRVNLSQRLEDQLDYLIHKKKKEDEKKERIKQLNEEYEQMRRLKERKIVEKISHSTEVRNKNEQKFKDKIKNREHRYNEIRTKIHHQAIDNLEKSLRQREKYSPNEQSRKKSQLNTSVLTQKNSLINTRYKDNLKETEIIKAEKCKKNLEMKLNQAMENKKKKNEEIQEKQREQIKQVEETNRKANKAFKKEQNKKEKQLLKKVKSVDYSRQMVNNKMKQLTQRKKKETEEKVRKWEQNYGRMQQQNTHRLSSLAEKIDYLPRINRSWKNQKDEIYLKLFNRNSIGIKNLNDKKAERILNKHQQISLKNKLYKEKKHEMIKYMKSMDNAQ